MGYNNSLQNSANGFSASVALQLDWMIGCFLTYLQLSSSLQLDVTENHLNYYLVNVHIFAVLRGTFGNFDKLHISDSEVDICTVQSHCW